MDELGLLVVLFSLEACSATCRGAGQRRFPASAAHHWRRCPRWSKWPQRSRQCSRRGGCRQRSPLEPAFLPWPSCSIPRRRVRCAAARRRRRGGAVRGGRGILAARCRRSGERGSAWRGPCSDQLQGRRGGAACPGSGGGHSGGSGSDGRPADRGTSSATLVAIAPDAAAYELARAEAVVAVLLLVLSCYSLSLTSMPASRHTCPASCLNSTPSTCLVRKSLKHYCGCRKKSKPGQRSSRQPTRRRRSGPRRPARSLQACMIIKTDAASPV